MLASKYAEPSLAEGEPRMYKRNGSRQSSLTASRYPGLQPTDEMKAELGTASSPLNAQVRTDGVANMDEAGSPPAVSETGSTLPPNSESPPAVLKTPSPSQTITSVRSKSGKSYRINIPSDTKNHISPLLPLSEAEVNARLSDFEDAGFDTHGYGNASQGMSRDEFPDPIDIQTERSQRHFSASVPDLKKWEKYVSDLTEQKLRALGVSSGDEEGGPGMSRQTSSSHHMLSKSPPVLSSSAASQNPWQNGGSFTSFSPMLPAGTPFQAPLASPSRSFGNPSRNGHLSRQSTFGFPSPNAQAASPIHPMWSPQQLVGGQGVARGGSPAHSGAMQSLSSILSPLSPDTSGNGQSGFSPQRGSVSSQSHQWTMIAQNPKSPNTLQESNTSLDEDFNEQTNPVKEDTKGVEGSSNWFVEPDKKIENPKPRGHYHNISETLERGVVNAEEYYPGEYINDEGEKVFKRPQWPDQQAEVTKHTRHQVQPSFNSNISTSKLNVEAKEFKFDPRTSHFRNPSFSKNIFAPLAVKHQQSTNTIGFVPAMHATKPSLDNSTLNVAAPSFQPGMKEFPFSSASFNFTAQRSSASITPVHPASNVSRTSSRQPHSDSADGSTNETTKIFSNVDFSDTVRPTQASKAVAIVKPEDLSDSESAGGSDQEDADGRITQSDARQKRQRQDPGDGDDAPLFAIPTQNVESYQKQPIANSSSAFLDPLANSSEAMPENIPTLLDLDSPAEKIENEPTGNVSLIDASDEVAPLIDRPDSSWNIESPIQPEGSESFLQYPTNQELDAIMEYINNEDSIPATEVQKSPLKPRSPLRTFALASPSSTQGTTPMSFEGQEHPGMNLASLAQPTSAPKPAPIRKDTSDIILRDQRTFMLPESPERKLDSPNKLASSNWDDVVSSEEESKFQARSEFFGSHVSDLIDNILKQRLDPLEKKLSEMGEFTRVPLREIKSLRRTSFPDKTSSDADDEEDSDTVTQSRPRSHKADLKIERLKSAVLEAMTSSENPTIHKIEEELSLRYAAERREADSERLLKLAEEQIDLYRKNTEDNENKIRALENERQEVHRRKDSQRISEDALRAKNTELSEEIKALKRTLDEYRLSHTKWREEIDEVDRHKQKLQADLESIQSQAEEQNHVRQSMAEKFAKIQDNMSLAISQNVAERAMWQKKDGEYLKTHDVLTAKLEVALKTKDRLDREVERLQLQENESIRNSVTFKETQNLNSRLESTVNKLTLENLEHQKAVARLEHEVTAAQKNAETEVQRTTALLQADVEVVNKRADSIRIEFETRLEMAKTELERAKKEEDAAKARFDLSLEEEAVSRKRCLNEAAESSSVALHEERSRFERSLQDLAAQHDRVLKNALEDNQHSEAQYQGKLDLSNAKIEYLSDKIRHLEDKVSVAQSAAQAAASAAQVSRAAPTASYESYEKVSPKALRESIVVLQEQLQQREARIDELEQQVSDIGVDTPKKLEERETEISWLRELLGVRIDDLSELINTVSKPTFDQQAVRNAAIRIRSSLQMEQHAKEKLISGVPGPALPTLTDIQNFASPKAAQLAAAWGNWRKGKQPAFGNLSHAVTSGLNETPSRPSPSAQTFLSGLITPPASNIRKSPSMSSDDIPVPMLAPRSPSRSMRNSPNSRLDQGEAATQLAPQTPPLMRKASYDQDAELGLDTSFDEDTGLVDGSTGEVEEIEPFGPIIAK